jgi:hypothetical protein
MVEENEYTRVTESDLSFLEKELSRTNQTFTVQELTQKLAFKKTSGQLQQEVKKYDPDAKYEIGDIIYKEYDEPLMVSSKGVEHFKGSVVLKVLNKIPFKNYNCEMLEVDYTGGGTFRKHIDYMKKTNTQVLLPSNFGNKGLTPQSIQKQEDPRLNQVPMTDKDLKRLERNLGKALAKSEMFFSWNAFYQLEAKRIEISEKTIQEIQNYFRETKKSVTTGELCTRFFQKDPSENLFDLHCLSLNHAFEKKFKKYFVFVSPVDWGKWQYKETLDSLLKDLSLSAPHAKTSPSGKESKAETSKTQKFPLKIYLTWREILSGGIRIPQNMRRSLAEYREYIFTDTEEEKDYIVYFYPSQGIFLGLKEFYQSYYVPQGASLNLEKKGPGHFSFGLKKSKKKLSVPQVEYDSKKDKFSLLDEEMFTYALPNKIIHLERDTLDKLISLYNQRDKLNLKELLILTFSHFGLEGENLFLHYLRAYHLVDILKHTTQEDVERTLIRSTEFKKSEKKKGIFLYKEKVKSEAELKPERPVAAASEITPPPDIKEALGEAHLAIGTIEDEVPAPEVEEELIVVEEPPAEVVEELEPLEPLETIQPPEPSESPKKRKAEKSKKEAPPPKKEKGRRRIEVEVAPRRRKGERKVIEERIELEESELEALSAIKEKRETEAKKVASLPKEEKEEYKPFVSEEPKFGLFAEKLQSALGKQKKKDKKKKEPKK